MPDDPAEKNEYSFDLDAAIGSGGELSDDDIDEEQLDDEEQDEQRANDPACAFCDDGGNVLYCDGSCMRSFHIGIESEDSNTSFNPEFCNPLGLPEDLARRIEGTTDPFLCPNCLSSKQQCFVCKKAGQSDPSLPRNDKTVIRCAIFECGHFYHPRCIGSSLQVQDIVCPLHTCSSKRCRVAAGTEEELVPCKRCPVAYHRSCIPQKLLDTMTQESSIRVWLVEKDEEGNTTSGVDRSLLYCMKHQFPEDAATPPLEAPLFDSKLLSEWRLDYSKRYAELPSSVEWLKKHLPPPSPPAKPTPSKPAPKQTPAKPTLAKKPNSSMIPEKPDGLIKEQESFPLPSPPALQQSPPGVNPKRRKLDLASRLKVAEEEEPVPEHGRESLPQSQGVLVKTGDEQALAADQEAHVDDEEASESEEEDSTMPFSQDRFWTEEAMKLRREKMWADVEHITAASVRAKTRMPEPYALPSKKTVTEGRMEQFKQIFRMADADQSKANQLINDRVIMELKQHEDNMRIVLAPYLHSERYSSYGRHFTKTDLLKYVSRKLQVFACSGDTVVDFSCGCNEFVPIFKRECLKNGKAVEGKAFDIITPRIVEDFELASWFDVQPESLPPGNQLIIGLNPPYGRNNVLAEKFLQKAATFSPRIIVLIVPPSTMIPLNYDVVLEDTQTMSDKSFYIPGLPERAKDQWNLTTPSFRVMSRRDCYPISHQLLSNHYHPGYSYEFPRPQPIMQPVYHPNALQPGMPLHY